MTTSWKRVVTLDLTNPPSEDRHLPSSDLHKQKKENMILHNHATKEKNIMTQKSQKLHYFCL